ncbi:MAG: homoserine dehydrogenase [Candidatus Margulisiibacteriota bacterium]
MNKINIGIIGLGTVGAAVAATLKKNAQVIAEQAGVQIKVKRVCDVRRISSPYPLTHDPMVLINDPEIDVIVEAIGGLEPARKLVLAALRAGKHVVTPNKELIAKALGELLPAADANGVCLLFEGAVGGGIPILNTIRDNLAANEINEIYGIVNGTTNYILSKMTAEGWEFADALKAAQKLGYAEADPKADIEGYDASYKATILASLAFGVKVSWEDVYREGIEKITAEDIQFAGEIGYVVKLLAIAKKKDGEVEVRVHPALVAKSHPLANVADNNNAIYLKGSPVGELMFYGPGAGGGPTASAVISDLISIAKGCGGEECGSDCGCDHDECCSPAVAGKKLALRPIAETTSRYYIRLQAADKHGVLAGISKAFADKKVSIAAVTQKENLGHQATIVILLHNVEERNLRSALKVISRLPMVKKIGNVIRIL